MAELTDNQKKVLSAIENGANITETISQNSGVAKGSITAVVNSLIKKGLVAKNDDATYVASNAEPATNPSSEEPEAVEQTDETTEVTVIEATAEQVAILIPYLKSEAAGEELKYALRAWEKNFKEDFRVVVIGDKEDWFSPEVEHIPHDPHLIKEDCGCPNPSMIRNPQADVTHKIFTAIAAGAIQGDFIISNDDIYLLGTTYREDIAALKAFGLLDKGGKSGGIYSQNVKRTAKALEENGLPIHRYGTHTPMLLEADKVSEIIEKYGALDKGYLLTSLYFNEAYPEARPIQVDGSIHDPILASVYRPNVEAQLLKSIFTKRKFLNCDSKGWISVKPHLEIAFPDPSRFEKQ